MSYLGAVGPFEAEAQRRQQLELERAKPINQLIRYGGIIALAFIWHRYRGKR